MSVVHIDEKPSQSQIQNQLQSGNNYMNNIVGNNQNVNNNNNNNNSDEDTIQPAELEWGIINTFQEIDNHGHYTDYNWVMNLNVNSMKAFIRDMRDVFEYRAGLTDSVKRNILPPRGSINEHNLRTWLSMTNDLHLLRIKAFWIMRKLVFSGNTQEDRALGTLYVLTALTLSSQQAAQAMPWLYEAVL